MFYEETAKQITGKSKGFLCLSSKPQMELCKIIFKVSGNGAYSYLGHISGELKIMQNAQSHLYIPSLFIAGPSLEEQLP